MEIKLRCFVGFNKGNRARTLYGARPHFHNSYHVVGIAVLEITQLSSTYVGTIAPDSISLALFFVVRASEEPSLLKGRETLHSRRSNSQPRVPDETFQINLIIKRNNRLYSKLM